MDKGGREQPVYCEKCWRKNYAVAQRIDANAAPAAPESPGDTPAAIQRLPQIDAPDEWADSPQESRGLPTTAYAPETKGI